MNRLSFLSRPIRGWLGRERKPFALVADFILIAFFISVLLVTGVTASSLSWMWWLLASGTFLLFVDAVHSIFSLIVEVRRLRFEAIRYRVVVDVVRSAVQMDLRGLELRSMVGILADDKLTALWREEELRRAGVWTIREREGDVSGR